jgi:hypothetical protein
MTTGDSRVFTKNARRAMVSQFLGFGLDAYDMALVLVMAPVLTKHFAEPNQSAAWQYLSVVLWRRVCDRPCLCH